MNVALQGISALICAFVLTMLAMPLVISVMTKLKAKQTILKYVEQHKDKSGTPTMGGIGFVLPACAAALCLCGRGLSSGRIAALALLAYSILGFFDDFLKIKKKDNEGLTPMQKLFGQLGIALVLSWYCFRNVDCNIIYLPFTEKTITLGWWYFPLSVFVFIALSNGVNLTDGLDGLASSCSSVYFAMFAVICFCYYQKGFLSDSSVFVFCVCMIGATIGFSIFNASPAKIFMGDTGSLGLGGAAAAVAMFSGNMIIIPVVGIMFVISCISVIIQVGVYKLKKKRVFLMAPFHHHLEKKGWSEPKIVSLYTAVTIMCGIIAVLSIVAWR